jgi:hypothetical protein
VPNNFSRAVLDAVIVVLIVYDFKNHASKVTSEVLNNDEENKDELRGVRKRIRILQLLNSCNSCNS